MATRCLFVCVMALGFVMAPAMGEEPPELSGDGWISLFNGEDLSGWEGPENGPWAVVDGAIDCDPARAPGVGGSLWSEDEYGDMLLYVEWRLTDAPTIEERPLIAPDGGYVTDEDGEVETVEIPNADSGIYLRGQSKAQINLWNWPVGSGEVWGYRTDGDMPDEVRAGVTPRVRADNEIGEWNTLVVSMIGDRLSLILNGEVVLDHAQLPGVAEEGPIALQYHGGYDEEAEEYGPATSLVQFRNIYVQPLD
ncbi:MAG: DUF1080 domain-containing protein [Candidatus Hydrogenedentota bacterium]